VVKPLHLHVGAELAESFIEVVHLGQNADSHDNQKYVGRRMRELILSGKRQLDSNSESLDGHDRNGAHSAADGQIYKGILLSIFGGDFVDHNNGENADDSAVEEEAGLNSVVEDLVNGIDFWIWGRMKDDDDRTEQTYSASNLAQKAEFLVEKVSPENGSGYS